MNRVLHRNFQFATSLLDVGGFLLGVLLMAGCHGNQLPYKIFSRTQACVLDPGISKQELVEHLNANVVGSESTPGLAGWKSNDANVRVSGIPFQFSTSIAVQAPRNLRILVSKPGGGQAVDLGSNDERFWFWTYERPELVTCRHDDTKIAMQHLRLPVQVDPEWLMEVFGVTPIQGNDYVLDRPSDTEPILDLVSVRSGPSGGELEKIIRVNACTGRIESHILRKFDGTVIAKAFLGDYRELSGGSVLPTSVRITLPQVDKQMKISLGHPEANPATFKFASTLWAQPHMPGARTVDIGKISRQAMGIPREPVFDQGVDSRISRSRFEEPAAIEHEGGIRLGAPIPIDDEPEWAHTVQRPITPAGWQPSEYSAGAWRSSSGPHPLERE